MENSTSAGAPWLVVGADGQIGADLFRRLAAGQPVQGTSRRPAAALLPLDLTDSPESWQLPDRVAVAYLCAAIPAIDRCRSDPEGTRLINVTRTLELARRLRDCGAHVVFLSTNQVFDGCRPRRSETEAVCPLTEYGRQKAEAERTLLAEDSNAAVVRFTKVAAPQWKLIRDWAAALGRGEPIAAFADMVMAPVPLAFAAAVLIRVGESRASGIFQVSGEVDISYADAARRLADRLGASRDLVRPIRAAERNLTPEMAPAHTTLDASRLQRELGLICPPVAATLDELFGISE